MKKIISLTLALVLCMLTFVACSGKKDDNEAHIKTKTPYEAYQTAFSKVGAMTNFECVVTIVDKIADIEDEASSEYVYKVNGKDVYYSQTYTYLEPIDIIQVWYTDEVLYLSDKSKGAGDTWNEDKEKQSMTYDVFKNTQYSVTTSSMMLPLDESSFEGVEYSLTEGVYYITLNLTAEQLSKYFQMTISTDGTYTVGFDERCNLVSVSAIGVYNASGGSIVFEKNLTLKNVGGVEKIVAPVDAATYTESATN